MKPFLSLNAPLLVLALLIACHIRGGSSRRVSEVRNVDAMEPSESEKISYAAQQAAAANVAKGSWQPKQTRFSERIEGPPPSRCVNGCVSKCVPECMGNPNTDSLCTEDCEKYCKRDCMLRPNSEYPGAEKKVKVKFLPPIQLMSSSNAVLPHQSPKMDSLALGPTECEPHCNFECNTECERKYEFPWKCPAECKRDCADYCKPLTTGRLNNGDKLVREDEDSLRRVLRSTERQLPPKLVVPSGNIALRWLSVTFTVLCLLTILLILYRLYGGKTYVAMYSKDKA
mmetsp:Transcript_409/g.899  ORF Transcript_409/g.899 Transcript_409/m.899 type:complete len:285 (-) Transcript_409:123-977(-)